MTPPRIYYRPGGRVRTNPSCYRYDARFDAAILGALDVLVASAHADTPSYLAAHQAVLALITEHVHDAETGAPRTVRRDRQ